MIVNGFKVRKIANPAAMAWNWDSEEVEYSITWLRFTARMMFGARRHDRDEWVTTRMADVWDNTEQTAKGAEEIVRKFLEGLATGREAR